MKDFKSRLPPVERKFSDENEKRKEQKASQKCETSIFLEGGHSNITDGRNAVGNYVIGCCPVYAVGFGNYSVPAISPVRL